MLDGTAGACIDSSCGGQVADTTLYCNEVGFAPSTTDDLQDAVDAWCDGDTSTYGAINTWDVSAIADMHQLFVGKGDFNDDISNWDVSAVTNMQAMFNGAHSFNQPLDSWNVEFVTNMHFMFYGAASFNQPLDWNVSSVTNMVSMFQDAASFSQRLCWYIQVDTNTALMLDGTAGACIDESCGGHVQDTTLYCSDELTFTPPTTEDSPFAPSSASELQDAVDAWCGGDTSTYGAINTWNVSAIWSMNALFSNKAYFNDDISNWDVSGVTNMDHMFLGAALFNQPLNSWNVSQVGTGGGGGGMDHMFYGAASFNQLLDSWDVSNVTNMNFMFYGAAAFSQHLCWDISSVSQAASMFHNSSGCISRECGAAADTSLYCPAAFSTLEGLKDAVAAWSADPVSATATYGQINTWDVSAMTSLTNLFKGYESFNDDISNWDVSSVENMNSIFFGAALFNQDLSSLERRQRAGHGLHVLRRLVLQPAPGRLGCLPRDDDAIYVYVRFIFQPAAQQLGRVILRELHRNLRRRRRVFTAALLGHFSTRVGGPHVREFLRLHRPGLRDRHRPEPLLPWLCLRQPPRP